MMSGSSGACPTYEDICTFCNEIAGTASSFYDLGIASTPTDYILYESDRFVVVPCLGPLTNWYVLIVPRRHVLSTGWLRPDERSELRWVRDDVVTRLARRTDQNIVVFEHGSYSFRDKGGACHDHSHVHVVATTNPVSQFVEIVSRSVELATCDDWIEAAAELVGRSHRSYLALESSAGSLIASATKAPSAFFRKALVSWLGAEDGEDDWLVFPHVDRVRGMIRSGL